MSVRTSLNKLIDWYESNDPQKGKVIRVDAAPNTVRKFARKKRGGPYIYRNRTIVPTREARTQAGAK